MNQFTYVNLGFHIHIKSNVLFEEHCIYHGYTAVATPCLLLLSYCLAAVPLMCYPQRSSAALPAWGEADVFCHRCCEVTDGQSCRHSLVFAKSRLCASNASLPGPLVSCMGQSTKLSSWRMWETLNPLLRYWFVASVPRKKCLDTHHLTELSDHLVWF